MLALCPNTVLIQIAYVFLLPHFTTVICHTTSGDPLKSVPAGYPTIIKPLPQRHRLTAEHAADVRVTRSLFLFSVEACGEISQQ